MLFFVLLYRVLVTCLGCLSCFIDGFLYPFLLFKLNIPIPYVSMVAGCLQSTIVVSLFDVLAISHLVMGLSPNLAGAMFGSVLMEMGYDSSTPAPSSIISVRFSR